MHMVTLYFAIKAPYLYH